jgi:Bifunctional DNA primase/polymerase, N-terminal
MGRAALAYVTRFGWYVFPIEKGTKAPRGRFVRHGHRDATNDQEQIRRWWGADGDCGIGLACKASGLVVLDADLYKPECEFTELEAKLGPLPQTPRQLTPAGGTHFLFRDQVGGGYRNPCAGAETKHDGYVLLAPSVHPNGGIYRWDLGAHPLETEIATLPDAWLRHLTESRSKATTGPALPSSGIDAADSWLGHAFAADGGLGELLHDGRRMVACPWRHSHSDGRGFGQDSSAVLFPRSAGRTLGGFRCSHSHCEGRNWRHVVEVLSPKAKWAADQAMRGERNRRVLAQLEAQRKGT